MAGKKEILTVIEQFGLDTVYGIGKYYESQTEGDVETGRRGRNNLVDHMW